MKDGRSEKRVESESEQLTRGEVLALLRVCWSRLMENGGKREIDEEESFYYYSFQLAKVYCDINEIKEFSEVRAVGFQYEEDEEEEDEEEDEEEQAEK